MKNFGFSLFAICIFMAIGCDHSTDADLERKLISVSIENTEVYEYRTGISGDEEGATIIHQARHFEISEILRNAETRWEAVYKYKPTPGFTGADFVELKFSTGSDGASPHTNIEIIKIEFTIN